MIVSFLVEMFGLIFLAIQICIMMVLEVFYHNIYG